MTAKSELQTTAEWFEQGRRCFHQPDGVGAVKAFEQVIDLDPGYRHPDGDNPYFYLGKIHEVEGRIEEAIVNYTRALAIDRYDEESLIGRGSCYTVTRMHEQAIADFNMVLRIPDQSRKIPRKHLYYVVAENYRQMEDWGQAIYWAQKALDADPGNHRHRELFNEISSNFRA